jgi:hypothetical protein
MRHTKRCQGIKLVPDGYERAKVYPNALKKRSLLGIPFPSVV